MVFQPVTRQSIPDAVVDQLISGVVSGALPPGDSLPSERRLAEELGVSRPTVRVALQRLAAAGLLDIRPGGATTVKDYRRGGGLELLPHLLARGGLDLAVVRSVVEARRVIGREVAALAAEQLDVTLVATLRQLTDDLAAEEGDRQRLALTYWEHIVDGTGSIVFRLLFNGLRAAYEPAMDALATIMAHEVDNIGAYRELTASIASGSGQAARESADRLLGISAREFALFLTRLEVDP